MSSPHVPSELLPFRCVYCAAPLATRDDIPRHETHCLQKALKRELWRLMLAAAHARETKPHS